MLHIAVGWGADRACGRFFHLLIVSRRWSSGSSRTTHDTLTIALHIWDPTSRTYTAHAILNLFPLIAPSTAVDCLVRCIFSVNVCRAPLFLCLEREHAFIVLYCTFSLYLVVTRMPLHSPAFLPRRVYPNRDAARFAQKCSMEGAWMTLPEDTNLADHLRHLGFLNIEA